MSFTYFIQTWQHLFDPNRSVSFLAILWNLVGPILILVALASLVVLYIQYRQGVDAMKAMDEALAAKKTVQDVDQLKHFQALYDKAKAQSDASLFNDQTPILKTFVMTLWWWISRSFIASVFVYISMFVLRIVIFIGDKLSPIAIQVPAPLAITAGLFILPILVAIKRNKPQWLKFGLTAIEVILVIAFMLELAFIYA